MNKTMIIGRLSSTPKEMTTTRGTTIVSAGVKVTETFQDTEKTTTFFVQAWSEDLRNKLKNLDDGLVYFEGRMGCHKSEEGKYFWNLNLNVINSLFPVQQTTQTQPQPQPQQPVAAQAVPF